MRALITGILGQDGSYLADALLADGHAVWGVERRQSSDAGRWRIAHLLDHPGLTLLGADLCDQGSLDAAVIAAQPDHVYNLAAQSFVPVSWEQPVYTGDVDALGVTRLLEAVRRHAPGASVVQASSSEMFGSQPPPQSERTPFHPRSPYGVAKVYGFYITQNYRESYKLHAGSAISFNHGSPRRGPEFVEQKIVHGAVRIYLALAERTTPAPLKLGNLDAKRDWLHAEDVVRAMRMMASATEPADYVVASGRMVSIRDICHWAFEAVGLNWREWVRVDQALYRPAEVAALEGDASKITQCLGWAPTKTVRDMVREMVAALTPPCAGGQTPRVPDTRASHVKGVDPLR